jgi:DNA modification methylase
MRALKISYKSPTQLQSRERNPRIHARRQIKQIAASIKEFGFVSPALIDSSNTIIAGHGRVAAAKLLGMPDIPTVCVDHLTPSQIKAYLVADNRLAELAGWDRKLLALELQDLSIQPDFDVSITGLETAEIDILIDELNEPIPDDSDELPDIDRTQPPISLAGDLWQIGDHRLLCGNALDREAYERLFGRTKAQLVFTDPPYNLSIGRALRANSRKRREFAMASGEMSGDEYKSFLSRTFANLCAASADGSIHFVCIDWRHVRELLNVAEEHYAELKNVCVWAKDNAGMGSLCRSQHELVCVFKNGTASHVNNVELGRFGRSRSNVWRYAGGTSFGNGRDSQLNHPTVKPLPLVADAIMDCSARGDIVLDAFVGSGTTLIGAERTGRIGRGIEIDGHYVDATLRRLQKVYGLRAVHLDTEKSFEQIARERLKG